ncbi:uncharacterized protein LOC128388422 [Panonychus citri]|uniref:uncharacterized protein LOC128388422 n=1 Tax=Panonychus citri TaxID=50023 RepID=UPI0023081961|nr:uncharacterized protein LOC128388422 [Panonychus citri]
MGLIRTTIKYGIPIGFVYWTIESGEWKPMGDSEDLKKTRLLYKEYDSVKGKIEPYVKPYLPEKINIPLNWSDLIDNYNGIVKKTILSMSKFDLVDSVKKLSFKLESSISEGSSTTTTESKIVSESKS